MQTFGSPASIIAAIREEADAEAERIEGAAAADLASICSDAAAANVGIADREERLTAARRMNEERMAKQEWDGRRAVIEQREKWMQRVVAAARMKWSGGEPATRREQLNALIREALSRLPRGTYEVAVSADDRDLVDVPDTRVTTVSIAGGCIVTIGDVSFDNSFEARARRMEPEWRNALSGMYTP
jgi:vacuolar-type H+-ATPase subunit E/Vma4